LRWNGILKAGWLICVVSGLGAGLTARAAGSEDATSLARAVDDHYNRLKTLRADFTETYRGAGIERAETGTLWLKKPGKMRWEYRSPKEKLFVSDGRSAWFYVPTDRQVRTTEVRKLEDLRSPLAFLLGKTRLEKELQGLSFAPDRPPAEAGNVVLRGVPKAMENRVSEVLVEVTPGKQIRRLVVEEVGGSTTEYEFRNIAEDGAVTDGQFHFTPPPGVETVTGDLGP
jgi:outer membrane lipoprotein carrier protein